MTDTLSVHVPGPGPETCDAPGCRAAVARGDRWIGEHCSVQPDGHAHFHHTRALHASVRAAHAQTFRRLCDEYTARPDDFPTAWHYLVNHPIFHRIDPRSHYNGDGLDDTITDVYTDSHTASYLEQPGSTPEVLDDCDGLADVWIHVSRAVDGNASVLLEHGPHLWPGDVAPDQRHNIPTTGQSSHDPRLDVEAPTYETAIVALAAKVRAHYGDDRTRIAAHWGITPPR